MSAFPNSWPKPVSPLTAPLQIKKCVLSLVQKWQGNLITNSRNWDGKRTGGFGIPCDEGNLGTETTQEPLKTSPDTVAYRLGDLPNGLPDHDLAFDRCHAIEVIKVDLVIRPIWLKPLLRQILAIEARQYS